MIRHDMLTRMRHERRTNAQIPETETKILVNRTGFDA